MALTPPLTRRRRRGAAPPQLYASDGRSPKKRRVYLAVIPALGKPSAATWNCRRSTAATPRGPSGGGRHGDPGLAAALVMTSVAADPTRRAAVTST